MAYPCTICAKCFQGSTALQQHMSSPTHIRLCTCGSCGRSFASNQALQQHMRSTKHAPLSCPKCGKTFGSLEAVGQHQSSTGHNDQSKTVSSTGLKNENLQQKSSQPPTQPLSHTRNKSSTDLHNLRKYTKPADVSADCSICKRSFCDQDALRQHLANAPFHATHYKNPLLKEATSSTPSPTPGRPARLLRYDCHLCVKTFMSDQGLQMHLASAAHAPANTRIEHQAASNPKKLAPVHVLPATQAPLQYCIHCQKNFNSPEALLSHLRSPVHALPQICPIPGVSSVNWQEFRKEMDMRLEEIRTSKTVGDNLVVGTATNVHTSGNVQVQGRSNAPLVSDRSKTLQPPDPAVNRLADSKINTKPILDNAPKEILHGKNSWSIVPIPQRHIALNALVKNCHSLDDLAKHGYFPGAKPNSANDGRSTFEMFSSTPSSILGVPKRPAVALDCEMVGVKGGRSELALLSAVDYITGEVLINTFVYPNVKVVDWRTCFSGITPSAMNLAKSEGRILGGWEEARSELWKHIDASTILVGHALQHDLDVLRVVHNRVVDSGILAKNAVGAGVRRQWGLKILCAEFLGTKIQNHGKKGHDCLEDTYATREVVLWCTRNEADFKAWGIVTNAKEQRKQKEREEKRKEEKAKKRAQQMEATRAESLETSGEFYDFYDSGSDEILRWSDIAEDFGYPKDYDPWSD